MATPIAALAAEIVERAERSESGCLLWTGYLLPNGYGTVQRHSYVHRVVWIAANGAIPVGWDVDHNCHNEDESCPGGWACKHRRCVDLAHLRVVPHRVNLAAGRRVGPPNAAANAIKTHCIRDHEFTPENTIIRSNGNRACRECGRGRSRAYARRKRAA